MFLIPEDQLHYRIGTLQVRRGRGKITLVQYILRRLPIIIVIIVVIINVYPRAVARRGHNPAV